MKKLEATKCKDGYLVYLTDVIIVTTSSEVYEIAKQNGLQIDHVCGTDFRIIAD